MRGLQGSCKVLCKLPNRQAHGVCSRLTATKHTLDTRCRKKYLSKRDAGRAKTRDALKVAAVMASEADRDGRSGQGNRECGAGLTPLFHVAFS